MNEIFQSKYHKIKLEITGWVEPNNGRMLRLADLFIDGVLKNDVFFDGWNRLDQCLDAYEMDSEDGKYVFIPSEGGGFLIEVKSLKKIPLPYKALSTATFIKNEFTHQNLFLFHTDEVIVVNIQSFEVQRVETSFRI